MDGSRFVLYFPMSVFYVFRVISRCTMSLVLFVVLCGWLSLFVPLYSSAQLVTELYETCTALEGEIARCGPGANCYLMEGLPTCHCVVDVATGLPLAGNPYKACTWDISGTWQLFSYLDHKTGFSKEILSPSSNEPFVIRMDRTDAILRTKYILGAIFVITALTTFSMGICGRAFLDARDNTSILFEQAEGFLDQNGRSLLLRTPLLDTTVVKVDKKLTDKHDIRGNWQKNDGSGVSIMSLKKPHNWPNFFSELTRSWSAYWYNDESYGAPLLRLSMALFVDKTLEPEKMAFHTNARFVQVGWYGALRFGSSRINIYSPADGKPIFTLLRIDVLPPFTPLGRTAVNLQQSLAPTVQQILVPPPTAVNLSVSAASQREADTQDNSSNDSEGMLSNISPPRFFGTIQDVNFDQSHDDDSFTRHQPDKLELTVEAANNILAGIVPTDTHSNYHSKQS